MNTCLFTGEPLDETTREEHTIPCSLAGRVRSKIVSSTDFNNKCSNIDNVLFQAYGETMVALRPLLASEHVRGTFAVRVPGDDRNFIIDKDGSFTWKGIKVVERDSSGRPKKVVSSIGNKHKLESMFKQIARPGDQPTYTVEQLTVEQLTKSDHWLSGAMELSPKMELAALKSFLLTFDHVLADDERRFTRSPDLAGVRDFVQKEVESDEVDVDGFYCHSLGIQYERLPDIQKIRSKIDVPLMEFEHIMVATGNYATKTLDAVWLVAGIDPFGFRLSDNWSGGDFTCTVINQMLVEGTAQGPFWDTLPKRLCSPNDRRSVPRNWDTVDKDAVRDDFRRHRFAGYKRAVRLVQHTCDDYLIASFVENALTDHEGGSLILEAILFRLKSLYFITLKGEENIKKFANIVDSMIPALPAGMVDNRLESAAEKGEIDWVTWLEFFRKCLKQLEKEFGLPGEAFVNTMDSPGEADE